MQFFQKFRLTNFRSLRILWIRFSLNRSQPKPLKRIKKTKNQVRLFLKLSKTLVLKRNLEKNLQPLQKNRFSPLQIYHKEQKLLKIQSKFLRLHKSQPFLNSSKLLFCIKVSLSFILLYLRNHMSQRLSLRNNLKCFTLS